MPTFKSIKIRMCVVCRARSGQESLLRLQIKNGEFCEFSGVGRSFYVCENCIPKCEKPLQKRFKTTKNLKEIAEQWQSKK